MKEKKENNNIEHLLLDIDGVLMRVEDYEPGIVNLREKFGIDPKIEDMLTKKNSPKLDLGVMKFSENMLMLNESMKKINKNFRPITEKKYYHALFSKSSHNKELIEHLKGIKNLKIHIFTNNHPGFIKNHTKNMRLNEWTDSIISSHEHNVIKPDHKFFNIALERIGADPKQCILLDDNPKNIAAAKELGINAVMYKDNIQAVKELGELLSGKKISKKSKVDVKKVLKIKKKTSAETKTKQKIAIIVHGWDGDPSKGWFVWLEKELKNKGFDVIKPHMPNPENPKIIPWTKKLSSVAKDVDKDTIFIGHSVGCQTILRYLENPKIKKVGKVVFVAPWLTLTDAAMDDEETRKIAKPWINTKIDFKKVKSKIKSSTAIFSDDDPFVPINNADMFRKRLGSKIIIQKHKGHFEEAKTKKILVLIQEIMK